MLNVVYSLSYLVEYAMISVRYCLGVEGTTGHKHTHLETHSTCTNPPWLLARKSVCLLFDY